MTICECKFLTKSTLYMVNKTKKCFKKAVNYHFKRYDYIAWWLIADPSVLQSMSRLMLNKKYYHCYFCFPLMLKGFKLQNIEEKTNTAVCQ